MNPVDWFNSADAIALLNVLFPMHGSGSMAEQPRKLRLYYCNLARLVWPVLPGPHRAIIETAERYADTGRDDKQMIMSIREIARDMHNCDGPADALDEWRQRLHQCGCVITEPDRTPRWNREEWNGYSVLVSYPLEPIVPNPGAIPRSIHRADLVHDAFLCPGLPISFDTSWRSPSAVSLADGMYETRDFAAMPALADVLEESGCQQELILDHCRDAKNLHARGCWVVDLILNR
jgi:hypothetical protein